MELRNQLSIKQTELNLTKDTDKRKAIETDITIIRYKLEIERIKQLIKALQVR